jgi:hypothetical protein
MLRKAWLRRQGYLQNYEGKPIPEVKGESRFSRFSHGSVSHFSYA